MLSLLLLGISWAAGAQGFHDLEWWEAYQQAPHTSGCSQRIAYLDKATQGRAEPALEASDRNSPEIRGYFPYLELALAYMECGNHAQALEMVDIAVARGSRIRQRLVRLQNSRRNKKSEQLYVLAQHRENQLGRLKAQLQVEKHQQVNRKPKKNPQEEPQETPPPTTPPPAAEEFREVILQPIEPTIPQPRPKPVPTPLPKNPVEPPSISEVTEHAPPVAPQRESQPPLVHAAPSNIPSTNPDTSPPTASPGTGSTDSSGSTGGTERPSIAPTPRERQVLEEIRSNLSVQVHIGKNLKVSCAGKCSFRPAEGALEIAGEIWLLPRGYRQVFVDEAEFLFPDRQDISYDRDLRAMKALMEAEEGIWLHLNFGDGDDSSNQKKKALSAIPAAWTAGALMFPTTGKPDLYQAARASKVTEIAALKTVDFTSRKAELLVDLARLRPSPDAP
ncbi:MAG: hypothetical protein K0U98_05575 [Deltaproteobacteria bacterium]|nr:hypothetical protein [Deltaproteobacteria bacterium]